MNLVYVSVQCSENRFSQLFASSKHKPGQQAQKYNRLLAEGLAFHEDINVHAVTALPVEEKNCSRRFIKKSRERAGGMDYYYLSAWNIHRIKDMLTVFSGFFETGRLLLKYKDAVVVNDILNAPIGLGAWVATKIFRRRFVGIVTDIPDILFVNGDKAYHIVSNFLMRHCTDYVFLTRQMNEWINRNKKPYVVIEGMVDHRASNMNEGHTEKYHKKVCMYTGTLDMQYGIDLLVDGFVKADVADSELHIYGSGDYEPHLYTACQSDKRIRYFGTVMNSEVVCEQKKATVLINPRPSKGEFTKYSFPSKNMEYMISGTPTIAVKLPGIEKEYESYTYLIQEETAEGFAKTLQDVLGKDRDELLTKGEKAKEFVLREKNNVKQAEKIIRMLATGRRS